jgi:hypothetical protein
MARLALNMDARVIARAKQYAKHKRLSVSEIVEAYFAAVTEPYPTPTHTTPILRAVRGILKNGDIEDYRKHVAAKSR